MSDRSLSSSSSLRLSFHDFHPSFLFPDLAPNSDFIPVLHPDRPLRSKTDFVCTQPSPADRTRLQSSLHPEQLKLIRQMVSEQASTFQTQLNTAAERISELESRLNWYKNKLLCTEATISDLENSLALLALQLTRRNSRQHMSGIEARLETVENQLNGRRRQFDELAERVSFLDEKVLGVLCRKVESNLRKDSKAIQKLQSRVGLIQEAIQDWDVRELARYLLKLDDKVTELMAVKDDLLLNRELVSALEVSIGRLQRQAESLRGEEGKSSALQAESSSQEQRLRECLARNGLRLPVRVRVDESGYLKLEREGTYLFDREGNVFRLGRAELKQLQLSKLVILL